MPTAPSVVALLVSHDGARWLPAVIEGIRAQRGPLAGIVCIDTASRDQSADLLEAAFGHVQRMTGAVSYPEAVRAGLEQIQAAERHDHASVDWVWLLHDDSNPDPAALETMLATAQAQPDADILGPKLREWPSLRRLLEIGVTISGTGRRETGLERGEYDQGQHDQVHEVLAVNTAGMLVRRSVLEELGGLDDNLAVFGNDIDFGWRAAAAGKTTLVVPDAVVFHAEAAHRGLRRTPLTGRHTHYQERRSALYTLLVNSRARALPFLVVRLFLGTLLRMLGFLLVRSVGEALDDLAALLSLYSRPGLILRARRARRKPAGDRDHERVHRLLAPRWVPYRHGLDFVGDLAAAATNQAADVAERRRAAAVLRDPSSLAARATASRPPSTAQEEEDTELYADTGLVARVLTNPIAVLLGVFVLLALIGARAAFGQVSGGGLSPAPEAATDWWRLYGEQWHPIGTGTDIPAPAYLIPLALFASVLGPTLTLSLVLVLAVPLALWGSWRFLRVVGRLASPQGAPRWVLLWGAVTYSLLPVTSGAWGDGRLGPVVSSVVLPWCAHAALGFADPAGDRRRRAAWRTGLLLAVLSAFTPIAWLFAVLLVATVLIAAVGALGAAIRARDVWGPPVVSLLVVPVLLIPWWLPAMLDGAGWGVFLEIGAVPAPSVDTTDLVIGRLSDLGAPMWLGFIPAVLAVLALLPRSTRAAVIVCWVVVAVAAVLAAALAQTQTAVGLSFLMVAIHAALVTAATLGGQALVRAPSRSALPRPAVAVGLVAAIVPIVGLCWFVVVAEDRLDAALPGDAGEIPAYMLQSAATGDEHGILVVSGDVDSGLTYDVVRGHETTLGEDEIAALTSEDPAFTTIVGTLASRPTPQTVESLGQAGIEYVVLPAPVDGQVAATLDASGGLVQASASDPSTRAWQVTAPLSADSIQGPRSWLRGGLLAVQGLAVLLVLLWCVPTIRERRR